LHFSVAFLLLNGLIKLGWTCQLLGLDPGVGLSFSDLSVYGPIFLELLSIALSREARESEKSIFNPA